ncbi:pectinesterase family protein [Streptomyces sp. Rer75]|uniref:pectinesterase family protein n=1 Tax=Streptomyces sp. Rer75 TaxID=2750011 RepID=UPI0015CFC175|nr:pectinesterase family protein [Streptomyces sp. Rer75]QLH26414.1 pectin esterase [Streptomyces sp. Rer75]
MPPSRPRSRRRRPGPLVGTLAFATGATLIAVPATGWLGDSGRAHAAGSAAAATLVVAKDGSGQYTTVQAAVNAVPANNSSAVTISVKPGTYRETVKIPSNKPHIRLVGSTGNKSDVTIVYNNASGTPKPGGGTYGTSGSATVAVEADDFQARHLQFVNDFNEANTSITDKQAVALRTAADKIVLDNIGAVGDQDTLLLDSASKTTVGRVYVNNSVVQGNVDFVFGRASAVINKSTIRLVKRYDGSSGGYVAAPSTAAGKKGFLFINSTVSGDVTNRSFYLGRPWHAGGDASLDPQTVVRNTNLSAAVKTTPWTDMSGFSWKDDRFAEYKNTGAGSGAASGDRPQLTDAQAADYEIADWLAGWQPS